MKLANAVITICVLAMSASCGGKSERGADGLLPPEPMPTTPTPLPDDDEALTGVATIPEDSGEMSSAQDMVLVVLDQYCGACHGRPSGADINAEPDPLEFTDDVDRMVALGVIEPFNGASSPLVQVMADGSMPPPGIAQRPTESEITMIRAFIDNPRLWPELPPVE